MSSMRTPGEWPLSILGAVSKLDQQWIDLFRAGNYGEKGSYDAASLDEIIRNYDPSFHEAPAVIGHPASDKPAYGWVESLRRMGDTLQGKLKQIEPQFAKLVEAGRFKKRSVALYKTAKGLSLRHVGFLGAQPPEVKGLADAVFHDETNEVIELTFEEESVAENNDNLVERIINGIKDTFGRKPEEPKTFSEADVQRIVEQSVTAATKPLADTISGLQLRFTEAAKMQAATTAQTRSERAIAALKANGRYLPAYDKMGVPQLFSELAKNATAIEFGEGEQKKSLDAVQLFSEILNGIGQIVPKGAIFEPKTETSSERKTVKFTESPGVELDLTSVAFHEAVQRRVSEKSVTYNEAMR